MQRPEEGFRSAGSGVSDGCEPPEVDAGNSTCVLCEDSMCSYLLRHLSSPRHPGVVFSSFKLVEAGSLFVVPAMQADSLSQHPLMGLNMHTRASISGD